MKYRLAAGVCVLTLLALAPAHAQTEEELKQQLEAQKQINELLKQRVRTLEQELASERGAAVAVAEKKPGPPPAPAKAAGDPEEDRALERALVRRGLSVLPPGKWELTPGLEWVHSGSSAIRTEADAYVASLDARIGLPWETMVGIGVPYFIESERQTGENSGFGDLALQVWKQFWPQSDTVPSLVGSLGYRPPTGEESGPVPLGSEFHSLSANLSAAKSIDPVVLYGGAFYSHAFSETIAGVEIQPGDTIGVRAGSSLAVTPEITGSLGLSVSFINELERDGVKIDGTDQTAGFLELQAGFLISRRVFLSLFANIGITDDAPDAIVGVSLPTRF